MKWLKKITDKIGYAPTLMLAGAVLPLAVFGAGELLSLILANLGFFHLKAFAMTISTGLTWGVIWPVMIGLSVIGLLVGGIIDIAGAVSKKIKSYKENKQISIHKVMEKKRGKVKTRTKQYDGKKKQNNGKHITFYEYEVVDGKKSNNKQISSNQKDIVYKERCRTTKKIVVGKPIYKYKNNTEYRKNFATKKHPLFHQINYKKNKNIYNAKSISDKNSYYKDLSVRNSILSR